MKKIIAILAILTCVFAYSHADGSNAQITVYDYGRKIISSKSSLKEKDFTGTDFFVTNIPNPYYKDFNEMIFTWIKKNLGEKEFYPRDSESTKPSYKEAIEIHPCGDNSFGIEYEKVEKKGSAIYYFTLCYDKQADDAQFREDLAFIEQMKKDLEKDKWIIENCSSPTIQKSRVVSVPRTVQKQVWVPGTASVYSARDGKIYGSDGQWVTQTYTVYVDEVQYYNEPNPNYNPTEVSNAKIRYPLSQKTLKTFEEELEPQFYIYASGPEPIMIGPPPPKPSLPGEN